MNKNNQNDTIKTDSNARSQSETKKKMELQIRTAVKGGDKCFFC